MVSRSIAQETSRWIESNGVPPRVILLKNHGIITLGPSSAAVGAAMFMAVKAAHIFAGSVPLGGPVFLSPEQIASIAGRRDEHYRQRALNLQANNRGSACVSGAGESVGRSQSALMGRKRLPFIFHMTYIV